MLNFKNSKLYFKIFLQSSKSFLPLMILRKPLENTWLRNISYLDEKQINQKLVNSEFKSLNLDSNKSNSKVKY